MTGLERLRRLAMRHARTGNALTATAIKDIADQIEREQGDAAVALREFAECNGFNPEAEPRDLLAKAAGSFHSARVVADLRYPAWEWVEEHGGLEKVKRQRRESVPREVYERKRRAWLGHIAECEAALGKRNARIAELEDALKRADRQAAEQEGHMQEMLPRLMPEGMEWPRFESGEFVQFGDKMSDVEVRSVVFLVDGILLSDCTSVPGWGTWRSYTGPIKRPAPKVLDADGVEIRVGDTVWPKYPSADKSEQVERAEVVGIQAEYGRVDVQAVYATGMSFREQINADRLTHRAPVLAADGRPLREGETVWSTDSGTRYTVEKVTDELIPIKCCSEMGSTVSLHPSQLTHEQPDSWERWRREWKIPPCDYCKRFLGIEFDHDTQLNDAFNAQGEDLVRRAKTLAGEDS